MERTGGGVEVGVNRGGEGGCGEGSDSLICFVCVEVEKFVCENKRGKFDESE